MKKLILIFLLFVSVSIQAQTKIFWTDGSSGEIESGNVDGTGQANVISGVSACFAAAVDSIANQLYWTDFISHTITRINLTSHVTTVLIDGIDGIVAPRGIALDVTGSRMFWVDNSTKKLQRSTLNGTSITDLITTGLVSPGYVAYDPVGNKVYFSDNGVGMKKIMRCNPDGSSLEDVVTGLSQVWGIAFNSDDNCIYWIDSGIDKIQKGVVSSLPVTKQDVITGLTGNIRGLVIDAVADLMYWSDVTAGNLKKASVSGGAVTSLFSGIAYPQGIAIDWDSALPIELMAFSSSVIKNEVILDWSTSFELNNSGFDIERTLSPKEQWTKIGFIEGHGTSNEQHYYSFIDRNLPSNTYKYRLKQIDFNGNYQYYDLQNEIIIEKPKTFSLAQNYPNPFNPSTRINYELTDDGKVNLVIFDITGRQVAQLVNENQIAGYYNLEFNAKNLSSGIYYYQINFVGTANSFQKTMKMMIVK
ncbi:MAG TPA: T9SS type A sorting domain-containing protein [Ignavibacteria bacterium]|nr:T9SS type A sorting domain-containing protein [Ignavibacteria bacterium]